MKDSAWLLQKLPLYGFMKWYKSKRLGHVHIVIGGYEEDTKLKRHYNNAVRTREGLEKEERKQL